MCAIIPGVIAGLCMVCNGTSDGMAFVCVMSDGVVCVMCRSSSTVCVMTAAMMSGACVPSAAVTGVCVAVHYLLLHGSLEEILETPENGIVLAPQVTVNIQHISGFT